MWLEKELATGGINYPQVLPLAPWHRKDTFYCCKDIFNTVEGKYIFTTYK